MPFKVLRDDCEYYREDRCYYYYDELGQESSTQSCQQEGCPPLRQQEILNVLGANRTFTVPELKLGTPLSWLKLSNDLKSRLVSRGGRPSDPYWDTKRLVPFRQQVWNKLSEQAKFLSQSGRKIGPAQLAAIIIENSLT